TRRGLILANATASVPLAILVIRAFMMGIPRELVEAARIDGAGQVRTFLKIIVPMSRNAIITSGLFAFLLGWNDFLFAVTLTSTRDVRPVTLGIYNYIGAHVQDWGLVMAAATLASLPALLMLAVAQRFVTAGSATSGLK
ncbi:MAG: carbohydrate ABC transporter permease, partial [Mycobacteriales bacterium]